MYADFCGVNTPTVDDFKLPVVSQPVPRLLKISQLALVSRHELAPAYKQCWWNLNQTFWESVTDCIVVSMIWKKHGNLEQMRNMMRNREEENSYMCNGVWRENHSSVKDSQIHENGMKEHPEWRRPEGQQDVERFSPSRAIGPKVSSMLDGYSSSQYRVVLASSILWSCENWGAQVRVTWVEVKDKVRDEKRFYCFSLF